MTRKSERRKLTPLLVFHRTLGAAAAVFVLALVVTGLPLNHTGEWGLDRRLVTNEGILALYGMTPDEPPLAFAAGEHWVVAVGSRLFVDSRPVATPTPIGGPVAGVEAAAGMIVAAGPETLLLLTPRGELIERLGPESLPGPVRRMGLARDGGVVIANEFGVFRANDDITAWSRTAGPVRWSRPDEPPAHVIDAALRQYRGPGVTWERVLLDLHSGRLFGAWGPYAVDLIAMALAMLALSGFITWLRSRRPKE